jgi:hypothetical protein
MEQFGYVIFGACVFAGLAYTVYQSGYRAGLRRGAEIANAVWKRHV